MKKLIICLAALLLPGCIEFEKQTLVFRHYLGTDTLVIWQHYEGIHGEDNEHGLSKNEREQLHSVVNGERTFFFANWIFEYNAHEINKSITKLEADLKIGIEPQTEAELSRRTLALAKLLYKSVTIKNGPFYLNKQQRPSATQHVTIRNIGKLLRECNALCHFVILKGDGVIGEFEEGDPNIELLEKSAQNKMAYLTIKGQQLRLRWPMTEQNFRKEMNVKVMEVFRKADVTIQHKNNLLTITVGKVNGTETAVSIPLPDVAFQPNATDRVVKRYGFTKGFNPAQARAKFFKDSDARFLKK